MLLHEMLAITPPQMLIVIMNEKREKLFDGNVCQVDDTLAKKLVKEISIYCDYSSCLQVTISATQSKPTQPYKRIVKNFDSPADLPTMLSVYDLMDFLKCGQAQAYQLTHSVGFPSIKFGGTIQIPKYLFIGWLEDQAKKQIL